MEDHKEVIEYFRKTRKRDYQFFSNAGKEERECWVVSKFLKDITVLFKDDELVSQPENSKVDVVFRTANFQIKEITDEEIYRTQEAKEDWLAVEKAVELKDLITNHRGVNVPEVRKGYELIVNTTQKLEPKYPFEIRCKLDLLYYVTRTYTSYINIEEINLQELSSLGWRSISCVMSKMAIVIYANEHAPNFIREKRAIS